ncbi:hypothetical protein GCK32_001947 [Trichostrongylus colubriformis]|uniref:ABC-2 type transporter transmembrane domain-containing protein n=1 Tax=Trichostrongylus colubriformis TaxID=6319 RepID=A0AAN8FR30_TRICO
MARDRQGFFTHLIKTAIVSVIIGMIFFKTEFTRDTLMNYKGAAIRATGDMSYIYLYPSIFCLLADLPAVIREYQSNTYAPSAYFLAVVLTDSMQYLIHPTVYSLIVYNMAGYSRTFSQFILFSLLNIVVVNVSTSVAYAAASICGRLTLAVVLTPMLVQPLFVFAGFFIDLRTVPIYFKVFTHISWFKYAYEAHLIILLEPIKSVVDSPTSYTQNATLYSSKNGTDVLLSLGFHPNLLITNFVILIIIIILIRSIALLAFITRIQRS